MSNEFLSRKSRLSGYSGALITGLGTATPRHQANHQASAEFATRISAVPANDARKVKALYRRTGINQRGSVLLDGPAESQIYNDFYTPAESVDDRGPSTQTRNDRYRIEAPLLAEQAARAALESSGLECDAITHLITVSCTGFNAPGIDIALIDQLELPPTTQRIHVGFMGCHAAINGLRAARGILAAERHAKVLLCCVEICSLHYQYGMLSDHLVSNAIFADGSAALILEDTSARQSSSDPTGTGNPQSLCPVGFIENTGSFLVPDSRDAMTWSIGDHGYQMTLSASVPALIEQHLKEYLAGFLAQHDEEIESIGGWAVHPGGTRILSAVENALSLSGEQLNGSRSILSEHGNMSSATMIFILETFVKLNQPKPWLMLGFGPGLEIEVSLIR